MFTVTDSVKNNTLLEIEEIIISRRNSINSDFFQNNYIEKYYVIGIYASQGILLGNYAKNFTSPFSLGFTGHLGINRWIASANYGLNFGLTKKELSFENSNDWSKRAFLIGIDFDINAGYKIFKNLYLFRNYTNNISLFPTAGIGFTFFLPFVSQGNSNNDYVVFIPYYKFGLNANCYIDTFQLFNLELGVKLPLVKHKYNEYFDGIMPYIKFGFEFEN